MDSVGHREDRSFWMASNQPLRSARAASARATPPPSRPRLCPDWARNHTKQGGLEAGTALVASKTAVLLRGMGYFVVL